jgi:hypothetical protein
VYVSKLLPSFIFHLDFGVLFVVTIVSFSETFTIIPRSITTSVDSTITPASNSEITTFIIDTTLIPLNSSASIHLVTFSHAVFFASISLSLLSLFCVPPFGVDTIMFMPGVFVFAVGVGLIGVGLLDV